MNSKNIFESIIKYSEMNSETLTKLSNKKIGELNQMKNMKTITTIGYTGNIAKKGYKRSKIDLQNCTPEFIDDFNQLLTDLKWSNFHGFKIHPRMQIVEIYSNPKSEPNPEIINEDIIQDNPNFDYLGSGDKDIFGN